MKKYLLHFIQRTVRKGWKEYQSLLSLMQQPGMVVKAAENKTETVNHAESFPVCVTHFIFLNRFYVSCPLFALQ